MAINEKLLSAAVSLTSGYISKYSALDIANMKRNEEISRFVQDDMAKALKTFYTALVELDREASLVPSVPLEPQDAQQL